MSFTVETGVPQNTSPFTITTLASPYNASLTLATSGAYTAPGDALTYTLVAGGTASGCSISAGVLSVTSGGTCLVVASQGADTTNAAQSTAVTTVNFYWNYAAYYEVTSETPVYGTGSCSGGDTLVGTECYHDYAATGQCPSGWTSNGSECQRVITSIHTPTACANAGDSWIGGQCIGYTGFTSYTCPSGGTDYGTVCQRDDGAATPISYDYTWGYACPYGGSLASETCTFSGATSTWPNI